VGPIVEQTRLVHRLLIDPVKTCTTLVTIPEELPVNEALEFKTIAAQELQMPVQTTLINSIYPNDFSESDEEKIYTKIKEIDEKEHLKKLKPMFELARSTIFRRKLQQSYIDQMYAQKEKHETIIELPFVFSHRLSIREIEPLVQILLTQ